MTAPHCISSPAIWFAPGASKRLCAVLAAGFWLALGAPFAAAQLDNYLATEPVGFIAVTLEGDSDTRARPNYITPSLVNPVEWKGQIALLSGSSVSFSAADWQPGAFNGGYYVEVVTGPRAGVWTDIVSSAANSLTLADSLSPHVAAGETVVIRRATTISDLFGPNNEAGLKAGGSMIEADSIYVYAGENSKAYWYYNGSSGGTAGWYDSAWRSAANAIVSRGDGVVIQRRAQAPLKLYFSGAVKSGTSGFAVNSGSNVFGGVSPLDISLAASGLYTGNSLTGIASASSPVAADQIVVYYNSGDHLMYWYYDGLGGGTPGWYDSRWRSASNAIIPAGATFIVNRKIGGGFQWFIPAAVN